MQESSEACASCAAFRQSVWLLYIDGLKLVPAGCCAICPEAPMFEPPMFDPLMFDPLMVDPLVPMEWPFMVLPLIVPGLVVVVPLDMPLELGLAVVPVWASAAAETSVRLAIETVRKRAIIRVSCERIPPRQKNTVTAPAVPVRQFLRTRGLRDLQRRAASAIGSTRLRGASGL